ncbi:hypothetical protein [Methylobacterium nodulans]|uniref:Uncharacterized protein n=1 Tax=Methylobacterium nodulans (strain LMG 21967 / CNCM I-2342 / ORS 2060) TaxID=460265 RepID=B8IA48_METNO|nr:hypothetical protein [Methylobacterium nodulans]ACL57276.1 conserved hypothetical protein [Methylobacterium nodulans ORS 2060]
MTSTEIEALTQAREQLARSRLLLARRIAGTGELDLSSVEALTKVIAAIESIDRVLLDAGQPYMPRGMISESAP